MAEQHFYRGKPVTVDADGCFEITPPGEDRPIKLTRRQLDGQRAEDRNRKVKASLGANAFDKLARRNRGKSGWTLIPHSELDKAPSNRAQRRSQAKAKAESQGDE